MLYSSEADDTTQNSNQTAASDASYAKFYLETFSLAMP